MIKQQNKTGSRVIKGTLMATAALSSMSAIAQEKPNIILFIVDDMGWQDTSVPFHSDTTIWNKFFNTPSMERLAAKGMKFTNAYAAPVSSPTRVSLMSGVNPTRHHVTNWTLHKNTSTDGHNNILSFGEWNVNGFTPDKSVERAFYGTPLPQILKDAGYATLFLGKAHFGAKTTPAEDPLNIGFDKNIGGHAAGGPGSFLGTKDFGNNQPNSPWGVPDLEKYHGQDIYLTEALTIEAEALMDEALEEHKPFFLYMSHYAVHVPFEADMRFYPKYIEQGYEEYEARYASMVEGMDKSLGDLMDYLDEKGIADNTVIIFMSDNGGYSVGVRSKTFNGINKNAPLRGGKGSIYEGGIREPMLVYAPNITKPASVNNSTVIIEDFFPTIVELAGSNTDNIAQELDSESFTKALKGGKINENRAFFWHYPNDWGERGNECGAPRSAIRLGDMKLIHDYETSTSELYNIKEDIGETQNLMNTSKKNQRTAAKLAKILSDRLRAEDAPMPSFKATGEQCPYPDFYFSK